MCPWLTTAPTFARMDHGGAWRGRSGQRSDDMPSYVTLVKWSDEGAKTVKDTVQRARQVRADFQRRGITRFDVLWTQGRYDIVAICWGQRHVAHGHRPHSSQNRAANSLGDSPGMASP